MESGLVVWITGLAGSGKSTICNELCKQLRKKYANIVYLDGDKMRVIFGDYGYDKNSRIKLGEKYCDFAKFLSEQGIIVIIGAIGMFNEVYKYNRKNLNKYLEVYIKCDFDELKKRDQKGLYSGAISGKIKDVVGISIPIDIPNADIEIDNSIANNLEEKARIIYKKIESLV